MKAMEAKYKKYLEKAKSVSYSFHVALSGALIFFVRISYLLVCGFSFRSLKLWIPNKMDLEMHQRYLYIVFFSVVDLATGVSVTGEKFKSQVYPVEVFMKRNFLSQFFHRIKKIS